MHSVERLLKYVRLTICVRLLLVHLSVASLVAGALALTVALLFPALSRLPLLALPALGILSAAHACRRRMPTSLDLAFYLDRRLGSGEAIVTGYEYGLREGEVGQLHARTTQEAERALAGARLRDVLPRLGHRLQLLLPIGVAMLAGSLWLPVPAPRAPAPGSERVMDADGALLERVENLADLGRDDAERLALTRAAEEARALRRELAEGMERREALDRIQGIRDALGRARRADTAEERRARDAALEALRDEEAMARALGDRDLPALDRAVERAAARREASDRERARRALLEAARAAAAAGDTGLERSLLQRADLLERRAEQARLLRELSEAMPELAGAGTRRALERLTRDGDGSQLNQAMVDASREAWSRLSAEERERLAEAMSRSVALENSIARDSATEAARGGQMSADALEAQLRQALQNLDEMSLAMSTGGGLPLAVPGGGVRPGAGGASGGEGQAGAGGQSGQAGPGSGGEHQESQGQTSRLDGDRGLLARVRPVAREGVPSASWVEWMDARQAGAPEASATPEGPGSAARGEAGGIERAPIPEDYREHLRIYFSERE